MTNMRPQVGLPLTDGATANHPAPTLASLLKGVFNVDAGQTQTCGLTDAGLIKCWKNNSAQDVGGFVPTTGGTPESNVEVAVSRFGTVIIGLND
jgi:hypothetical protein